MAVVAASFSGGPISQYYLLISSVIFYYDFILTMPREIKHVWSSKLNAVNLLVIALRYITAFEYIPIFVIAFAPSFSGEQKISGEFRKVPGILGIICQSCTSAFLIIRLYAIFDRNRWILYATIPFAVLNTVLSSLAIGTAKVSIVSDESVLSSMGLNSRTPSATSFCFPTPSFAPGSHSLSIFRLSYICILFFDTLIFVLALSRMGMMYCAKRFHGSQPSLVFILFRDGIMFFAILTISNLFNLVIFVRFFNDAKSISDMARYNAFLFVVSSGTNSELTHSLSVILVSRMIFNLRDAGAKILEGTEDWRSRLERDVASVRFRVPTDIHD
ncbi:hypothetical protein SCHPADRAFT_224874 [Schizopora paradoxa]|uniref:DUF6533 domain-containing protein n=1 Tax=Schizopora paradoxa TaxID=27342 RepID=A0A0H2RX42_9AGAM|nr:hypothetical protein SCHPADRAFT_224874 [Schizopora paradoxa]